MYVYIYINIYFSEQAGERQTCDLRHEMLVKLQAQPSGVQGQEAPNIKSAISLHWLPVETRSLNLVSISRHLMQSETP